MSASATNLVISYFGKVPTRGDFVKSSNSHSLLTSLDAWVTRAMENMSEDPRWKSTFDAAEPLDFAFVGTNSTLAIAGHIRRSEDSAHRRFPFLAASAMEVNDASTFIHRSPMALARVWNRLRNFSDEAQGLAGQSQDLAALAASPMTVDLGNTAYEATIRNYFEMQTVGALQNALAATGFVGNVRHTVLAIGLLLQPVMASGSNRLDKSLCFPLPTDPMYQHLTATFWLSLVSPFLQRADFELSLYIGRGRDGQPLLVLGFDGASAQTLTACFSLPTALDAHLIHFDDASWAEESVASEYGVAKLASYLEQGRMSLESVFAEFNNVFLGR